MEKLICQQFYERTMCQTREPLLRDILYTIECPGELSIDGTCCIGIITECKNCAWMMDGSQASMVVCVVVPERKSHEEDKRKSGRHKL
jgi:hypothetical protein